MYVTMLNLNRQMVIIIFRCNAFQMEIDVQEVLKEIEKENQHL